MSASVAARMSQARSTGSKLTPTSLDDLGRAVLLLATEVSVLNDRQRVLETILQERGIDISDAVRDHVPAGALAETLQADRARLAKLIVEALCPPEV